MSSTVNRVKRCNGCAEAFDTKLPRLVERRDDMGFESEVVLPFVMGR